MSPSTRRLLKESTDLQTNPSPYFHAAPVSDTNLFDWHFTLLGPPPPSPYAGGIYHGRITLPPTYPLRPPSFRFLTPSGRFEVNREICLSISGHHEETWQPAWGIRTALIALRSFMDGDAKGQVGGLDVADEVRRRYARESRAWRCDGCEGSKGRGNEVVMREWWGVCRERGVGVEGEDFGGDESEDKERREMDKSGCMEGGKKDGDGDVDEAAAADAGISAGVDTSQIPQAEVQAQAQQPQQQQLQHTPPATRPAPPVPAAAAATSQDTPWLDRAIIGIIIALVAMILRRLTRDMDLD
ncbi:ubiquitin-conjugating enzyme E2 J1 [Aspergillus tubingensis]|uniref:Ubiquitin conjugating enzyme n=2 Tax=Aspergillus subgen. Circumdati TaxID=2720871 RepID=A0A100IFH2_ASPNG|nr:ubiquitin conjugating enzyme [Aspergillus niger]GLA64527.1 ubiquitin-conjugating enzyme E2 J1 [Aspergillus tubingensis]GLA68247.1 ubiquitin-conjugating enzyme E2 J1 [Aspergillus tubingensis]GLA86213.1 ubiquitin-conjugating enzyme E2 J1 [Aspergillus tubingensis]